MCGRNRQHTDRENQQGERFHEEITLKSCLNVNSFLNFQNCHSHQSTIYPRLRSATRNPERSSLLAGLPLERGEFAGGERVFFSLTNRRSEPAA